ncbi:MAG TPA: hypothetical protein VNL39_09670 [Xanthobacteraceae bacterium]|nr:hypothetical protein [Xanthobacteraceae bacterium]
MNLSSAFITNNEAEELIEPGEAAFDEPTMAPELGFALDIAARDVGEDAATTQLTPVDRIIVALVGMNLAGALARSTARATDRRDAVNERDQPGVIVDAVSSTTSGTP